MSGPSGPFKVGQHLRLNVADTDGMIVQPGLLNESEYPLDKHRILMEMQHIISARSTACPLCTNALPVVSSMLWVGAD
jgi:hypothetical protein